MLVNTFVVRKIITGLNSIFIENKRSIFYVNPIAAFKPLHL